MTAPDDPTVCYLDRCTNEAVGWFCSEAHHREWAAALNSQPLPDGSGWQFPNKDLPEQPMSGWLERWAHRELGGECA